MPAAARLAPMSSRLAGPGVGVGGEVACGSLCRLVLAYHVRGLSVLSVGTADPHSNHSVLPAPPSPRMPGSLLGSSPSSSGVSTFSLWII